ncbi:MAG: hypothetical protein Q7J34_04830 [Bacteroidales bacterium]|jgi:tetratricopeptide (TPR) repeat protein|nr:hypothetical protein [Bacteroidales bacterium]
MKHSKWDFYRKSLSKSGFFVLFAFLMIPMAFSQRAEDYQFYMNTGREEVLKGNYTTGIVYFDTAIRIMPYYPVLYQDRGYAHLQMKQYGEAASDFSKALDKKPWLTELRFLRGVSYFNLGKTQQAYDDFIRVTEENPQHPQAFDYMNTCKETLTETFGNSSHEANEWARQAEEERYYRSREREAVIWGTVIPLLLWTAVFASW